MTHPHAALARGLSDRYELETELGRGGMATVWLAWDRKYDRRVAVKVLRPEVAGAFGPDRFRREIRVAAQLHHPHILPVLDSGEIPSDDGRPLLWYAMPYVDGESLRERLRREGLLPPAEARRIAREAALALHYAHEHGVVHRDVKPENLLLARDGTTLVADFGIARALGTPSESITVPGFVVGTPGYMSPEQARGSPHLDRRSDIYSLGCVLHEMLTGQPPAGDPTVRTSDTLSRAVLTALAPAPADRFATAQEFATALEGPVDGAAPRPRPRPALAAAVAGVLLAAGFVGVRYLAGRPDGVEDSAVASGFARKLTQLTVSAGTEEWPAWSPDGTRLAYVADANGHKHIFVRTLPAGPDRRITDDGVRDDIQPAWSPDGTRLAFVRAATPSGRLEPTDIYDWFEEDSEVWTVDVTSGAARKLIDDAFNPSFAPDGMRIAVDAAWAGPRRIWILDASGRNPRQVTTDSTEAVVHVEPAWSPDGSRLAFRRIDKTRSDIVVLDLATQRTVRITDDNALDMDPAWAPDGRALYFTSSRGGGLNLWRVAVDESGAAGPLRQLTTGAGHDVLPSVGPDGQVAFAVRGINSDLWRIPVSPATGRATGRPEPVAASTRVESRGAWSPDGARIAFNSDRLGEMNLWVRDLGTGTERQVTTGHGGDYQADWSPDGRRLAFFSARAGNTDIWSVDLESGALTRLTDDPATDTNPFWSPTGDRIAFMSDRTGRTELWVMNADGSDEQQLTTMGVDGHFVHWSRDGSSIAFRTAGPDAMRILRVALGDTTLTELPTVYSGNHLSFSPDGSVAADVRGHKQLWMHPMDGRDPYVVWEFDDPEVRIDYPVWSPDGRWILFDRAEPRGGDLWLLAETE